MSGKPSQTLPPVPVVRILAIGTFATPPTLDELKAILPAEVSETAWLYEDGKIDQWFSRLDREGVVFLMNVTSVEEAESLLEALPLGKAGKMTFELIPLGPLKPLRFLLHPRTANS